jgi:hypothetical protein
VPSLFSVGGIQSRVAEPDPVLTGLVEVLSMEATVVVPVLPAAEPAVLELVVLETGAVLVAGVVLGAGAVAATVVEPDSVLDVRSMKPTLGLTRLGADSAADAVSALLEAPSAPQAARPKVKRLHNTTLRICDAAKVDCVI